jgi:Tfp pilus assembly protein PilF
MYTAAIELEPNDSAFHNNCGVSLAELGKYEEAIK